MCTELAKLGIEAGELEDGLWVKGVDPATFVPTPAEIACHNDHRIAMSFAVLGARLPGITIGQKDCVDKTFPEFWATMTSKLGLVYSVPQPTVAHGAPIGGKPSIVLVGMRGAGKTHLGAAAAKALGFEFVDLDALYVSKHGAIMPTVEQHGWPVFREREVELQSAAAAAGLAPRIFFSTWLGGSGKDAIGLISMQRLSQPTFFKWLIWQTEAHRDTLRSAAARARSQEYLVDPKVAKSPLYKTWAAEARRLRAGLRTLGIAHGDVHENNLVFHVEAETCPTDEEMASDDGRPARKKRLLDTIALGPSGPARLLIIDFGRAKSVKGRLAWLMEDVFGGGRRMVDPTQVPST